MGKVIVFLAEGFEEVEALTVVDYLRRVDIEVDTVSITNDKKVKGSHDIVVMADKTIDDLGNLDNYNTVIIPGGMPGASNLRDNERVINIVKEIYEKQQLVAAICAGPIVLHRSGILDDKLVTSFPGFEEQLTGTVYTGKKVEKDGNIITARGPYFAVDFALEIVDYLFGEEKLEKLKKSILYNEK